MNQGVGNRVQGVEMHCYTLNPSPDTLSFERSE